jgi:GNAT superfamily N-acetyltransferase
VEASVPEQSIVVRPPETAAEVDAYCRLAWRTIHAGDPSESGALGWGERVTTSPGFTLDQMRLAFRDDTLLGGCVVFARHLHLGAARLLTGCVAAVATDPAFRKQGIASAFLADALANGQSRGYALMLLDGIADFYRKFGYYDVFDWTRHGLDRSSVLAQPPTPLAVRPATVADVPALLALFQRDFGGYSGHFTRDVARQEYVVRTRASPESLVVATDESGLTRGYAVLDWSGGLRPRAREVAADDWAATLALAQHHALAFDGQAEPPVEIVWYLPPGSPTQLALADRLPLRSEVQSRPDAGWQARVASAPALFAALAPLWQARWSRAASLDSTLAGPFRLGLRLGSGEGESGILALDRGAVTYMPGTAPADSWITLPPATFIPLLFGYRSLGWAESQPGVGVPAEARAAATALFTPEPLWIPGTDAF